MSKIIYPPASKPMSVARRLVADCFTINGSRTLAFVQHQWWMWNGRSWGIVDELNVRAVIWDRLENVYYEDDKGSFEWAPSTSKVTNLIEPLQILTSVPQEFTAPAWLDGDAQDNAGDLVSLENGVLNLRTGAFTKGHTPALFVTWHLPFRYQPKATCPTWEWFLGDIFAHDPSGRRALQEWFGYVLSGRTDLQKGFGIIGPSRGGKGVISRTLKQIIGAGNHVSPSLATLGGEFGMQSLVGKPLAILEDARSDRANRTNIVVERLLSIIGEDQVSINRKNTTFWDGTLPTRVMLVSNEVPTLGDASGAITGRFVWIKLRKSYKDNPDTTLGARINRELPGIFLWALEGLRRLDATGEFTEPSSMGDVRDLMADLSQPTMTFLDESEKYEFTGNPKDWVLLKEVHHAYKVWCDSVGASPLKQVNFANSLDAANPDIVVRNKAVDGEKKARRVFGVKEVETDAWIISQSA
ncbi:phage/plasmid primase, P4 family [Corynebacterium vitaeruminis]|uniref:DNA primase family protein n=1 Tax=Corynebacterium vitaeruminis TaxID=38305 RepID=UPI00068A5A07|nr:phage/plasmid primase, P4 family [Corynebacterium vitaeruminis]